MIMWGWLWCERDAARFCELGVDTLEREDLADSSWRGRMVLQPTAH